MVFSRGMLFLLAPALLLSDQVLLKNGDRLSGRIVRSDEKALVLKSEYAGEIKIDRSAVSAVSSDGEVHVTLKGGSVLVGPLRTEGAEIVVSSATSGAIRAPLADVTAIRGKEEQLAHEKQIERLKNPGLIDLWAGYLDLGLATARGNARTTTFNTGIVADRVTTRDRIGVYFTQIYATQSTTQPATTIANQILGGIKYNVNLNGRAFAFGFTDLEFNEFQKLDLRNVVGGGAGYQIYKGGKGFWNVNGGATSNREFFSTGLQRSFGELLIAEESNYQITPVTKFIQKVSLFPNLTSTGNFRLNLDAGLSSKLLRWLDWQISFSNRYFSNPLPGLKKNDVLFTTGLRMNFKK